MPGGFVPDLDPIAHADESDFALQSRALPEMFRNEHATGRVDLDLDRHAEKVAIEAAIVSLQDRGLFPRQALGHLFPFLRREDEQTGIEAGRDHLSLPHFLAELGRKREAVLVIDSVEKSPDEHGLLLLLRGNS